MTSLSSVRDTLRRWRHQALVAPHEFAISRWLYLRLLGCVLLIAFLSFWTQLEGLVGQEGILPVSDTLARYAKAWGASRVWRAPTLLWLWPNATGAHVVCAVGTLSSFCVIFGRRQALSLLFAWVSYLSLFYGAQRWLGYQWDLLLLETTFVSIFLAPWCRNHWLS